MRSRIPKDEKKRGRPGFEAKWGNGRSVMSPTYYPHKEESYCYNNKYNEAIKI